MQLNEMKKMEQDQQADLTRRQMISWIIGFIVMTYSMSSIGFGLWLSSDNKESLAALIPILAPLCASIVVYYGTGKKLALHIKQFSVKGFLTGIFVPCSYMLLAILIFLGIGKKLPPLNVELQQLIILIAQWFFAGFCEEIGWRCVLMPLLSRCMSLAKAYFLTGVFWAGWHLPMLWGGIMVTGQSKGVGTCLFFIEVIAISFILGIISEKQFGKSIWAFVSFHATHNIVVLCLVACMTKKELFYLDDGGVIVVGMISLFAIVMWFRSRHMLQRK